MLSSLSLDDDDELHFRMNAAKHVERAAAPKTRYPSGFPAIGRPKSKLNVSELDIGVVQQIAVVVDDPHRIALLDAEKIGVKARPRWEITYCDGPLLRPAQLRRRASSKPPPRPHREADRFSDIGLSPGGHIRFPSPGNGHNFHGTVTRIDRLTNSEISTFWRWLDKRI